MVGQLYRKGLACAVGDTHCHGVAEWKQQLWTTVDDRSVDGRSVNDSGQAGGRKMVLWSARSRRLPVDRQANARDRVSGPGEAVQGPD